MKTKGRNFHDVFETECPRADFDEERERLYSKIGHLEISLQLL